MSSNQIVVSTYCHLQYGSFASPLNDPYKNPLHGDREKEQYPLLPSPAAKMWRVPRAGQTAAGLCKMFANYCGCVVAGIKEAAVSTILSCSSGHQQPRHSHVSSVSTSSIHLMHRNNCKYLNIVIYSSNEW